RLDPLLEDRSHRGVFLQVDAADLPGTVVHVEVAGQLGVFRLDGEGSFAPAHRGGKVLFVRIGRLGTAGEVLGDVGARPEEAFLLAAPERDADGALRRDADGLEDAHRFHRRDRAGAVVGGAGAAVPRV